MSLHERLSEGPKPWRGGLPCSVAAAIEHLARVEPDEATALQTMLDDRAFSNREVYEALAEDHAKLRVSLFAIGHHRRHSCRCPQ